MDPPPAVAPPPQSHHLNYPDSVDSSPRSRNTDSWDEPLPPTASTRLRLMCSYGGHIVPRPHDKSLCYVGGDTRIVVVDRHTSLNDLSNRLSKTLLNGRPFTLKYQLPSEDLDSLISVTTDEDLDNMIDEYDRTTTHNSSSKPSRLRLFLFPFKPDSAQSMGPILDMPAKSDDWFLNALNGAAGMLNRGFSDSASVNCLLGLDDDGIAGAVNNLESAAREVEASMPANCKNAKQVGGAGGQDVHSVPDSPMLENSSSFGSTSSSPSLANLPPIRVHVEDGSGGGGGIRAQDQKVVGIEEQFAQMNVGCGVGQQKQDDGGFVVLSSPPPMPTTIVASAPPVSSTTDYLDRVVSDDERSDHGVGYRKPPTPQPQPQTLPSQSQQKSAGVLDLPSPDSVSSDSSVSNPLSRSKPVIYQDPVVQIPSGTTRFPANLVDPKVNMSDPNSRVQMQQQQVLDSGYVLQQQLQQHQQQQLQQHQQQQLQQHQQQQLQQHQQQQLQQHQQQQQQQQQQPPQQQQQQPQQQQQFIHAGAHYIQHHPAGSVPIPAYYPVYPSHQQQQHHPHHHPQLDQQQQYQVYYMPARQAQPYTNLPVQQSNISEAATIASSRSQTPPNPTMVSPSAAYNPIRNTAISKPELAAGVYRTATTAAPPLVQVPSTQHQQQYVSYTEMHHPSQSAVASSAGAANYAYEYADPSHPKIYYTQPLAPTMPSQYQTMTAAAAMVLPEVSAQLPTDNIKQR